MPADQQEIQGYNTNEATRVAPTQHADAGSKARRADGEKKVVSNDARGLVSDLMALDPDWRADIISSLPAPDLEQVLIASYLELGTQYGLWRDDPVGFSRDVVGENVWSIQAQVLRSVVTHDLTAVPSCFSAGKSHSTGLITAWFASTRPVGTAVVVTIAPRFRQVQRQVWPGIKRVAGKGLPGHVDTTQWKMPDREGNDFVVAYGLSVPPYDESAVQGVHWPELLWVVDEAGGFNRLIGGTLVSTFSGGAKGMFIGNPPSDDEDSWFESLCNREDSNTITIDAFGTPNFTGERTPLCRSCPPQVPQHRLSIHLVSPKDITGMAIDWGEDSPYYQAKARAQFPRGGASRAIPPSWLATSAELAHEPDPLGLAVSRDHEGNLYRRQPRRGSWIRLGVDVASGGGDELVIARCEDNIARVRKTAQGAILQNNVEAAGIILAEIRMAEELARDVGSDRKVRVKIEANGVGWGVIGTLKAWGTEGMHNSEIIAVDVAESPNRHKQANTYNPRLKRHEMWLAMRVALTPHPGDVDWQPGIILDVDAKTIAQLGGPTMSTDSGGYTLIETKADMKKRGLRSPDRADAILLSTYEPSRGGRSSIIA